MVFSFGNFILLASSYLVLHALLALQSLSRLVYIFYFNFQSHLDDVGRGSSDTPIDGDENDVSQKSCDVCVSDGRVVKTSL